MSASVVGLLYLFRGWNSGKRSPVISVVDQIAGYRSRLEILSAIATQSTAGMPVESIIDQTLQLMHQHFPDIRSSYGSLNESGFFLFVASVNPPGMPDLEHPDVDLQHIAPDYLTRLRKNNLLIIPDIAKEALPEVLMERLRYTNTNALLVVPVQHSDQLLGLLTLQVSKPHEWTEIEITIAREVAEHLAIAIHDANELQERQHTDVALQRSEELYRLIAENSTDMISKRTSDGHITYVSPACRSLLGYEPEELVGQNAYQFYHPDDLQMVLTALEPVFHSATVTTATYRIRRKDGRYIWFETRSQGIDNAENGKLQEIICSSRDVTERHEAQARLQESEIRFQQMNATIDDLFWFSEQRLTKLIYVSPALKKIWGLEVEAVLRDPQIWWATVHPDDLPVIRGIMRNAATEGEQRLFAEALSRSAQTLNSTLNLQEVLARVIDSVVTVLPPCDLAHVYLLEGGVAYLSRSHAYTEIGKAWENTNPKLDIPSLPNLLKTITDLQPSVISDTRDYPQWIVLPGAEGVRSVVAAAIILDDIAIGLMILNSVVPGTYLPFHGERLQAFANQASIAIRNARLYEEVQHYVDQLELRVGERTAELLETNERLQVILETTAEGICYTRDAKIQYANRAF